MLPKKGDFIELIEMNQDPAPLAPGDQGEVLRITPLGHGEYQIIVDWVSGRCLHLLYPVDKFKILKSSI